MTYCTHSLPNGRASTLRLTIAATRFFDIVVCQINNKAASSECSMYLLRVFHADKLRS
jgi:hypothetical protein